MYETHTDGRLIAEMRDEELLTAIKNIAGRMGQAVDLINGATPQVNQSVIGILNPSYSPKALREKAESSFKFLDASFSNYVMEGLIRGLDMAEYVQKAYRRSEGIGNPYGEMLLLD